MHGELSGLSILPALIFLLCGASITEAQTFADAVEKMRAGAFNDVIAILQPLERESPQDVRILNLLGAALSASGKREEGNTWFSRALTVRTGYLPAVRNLALNDLALGWLAEARTNFEEVERQSPADSGAQLGLAQVDFAERRFESAVGHYERSGGLYLKDASALLGYATSCVETKQTSKALDAIAQLPDFDAGLLLARLERYADAAKRFESALAAAPDAYQVRFNLTLAYLKSGNYALAVTTAEGTAPTSEVSSLLAQALEALGKTAEAYEALRQATARYPEDEGPYVELMALCAGHENYDLSLTVGNAGLHRLPSSKRIRSQRGIVLAMMGRFTEAEADLRAANGAVASVAYALVLMRTGNVAGAVDELRKRCTLNDGDYLAHWFLGEALMRQGERPDEALRSLRKSVELNPNVPQSQTLFGKLLLAHGDTDEAVVHLERSLQLDSTNVTAMYQLAQAYRRKGNAAGAADLFAKVVRLKAQDDDTLTRDGMMRIIRDSAR